MDKTDMIGLLIVAVVAVGSVAFMMGVFSAPSENLAGEAIKFAGAKPSAGDLTARPPAARSAPAPSMDRRAAQLSQRARRPGSYLSSNELLRTLRVHEYEANRAHQICQKLGYRECLAVQEAHAQWYYASTDGRCSGPQVRMKDHYLTDCDQLISREYLQNSRFSEPSGSCITSTGRSTESPSEPELGGKKEMRAMMGILCQK